MGSCIIPIQKIDQIFKFEHSALNYPPLDSVDASLLIQLKNHYDTLIDEMQKINQDIEVQLHNDD